MSNNNSTPFYTEAYLNAEHGYQLQVASAVFGFLAVVCVVARLAARVKTKVRFGADDYLIIAAGICGIAITVEQCMLPAYGVGRHVQSVSNWDFEEMMKVSFAFQLSQPLTLMFAKLSILALYYRIFGKVNVWFVTAVWGLAVYIVLWLIGMWLAVLLECRPVDSIWLKGCAPSHATTISTGVLNVVSDLAVFLLPQPIIWRLQMPLRHKLAVSGVLVLGLFATVISIVRIPISVDDGNNGNTDLTWNLVVVNVLAVLEPLVAIICACLPVMQIWFRKVGHAWMSSRMIQSLMTKTGSRKGLVSDPNKSYQLESQEDASQTGRPGLTGVDPTLDTNTPAETWPERESRV